MYKARLEKHHKDFITGHENFSVSSSV